MNVTVLYVGSSLLGPLKNAERSVNEKYQFGLRVAAYNFGAPLSQSEWRIVEGDLREANIVFVIHVMDGENAARLLVSLDRYKETHDAVVVINCMPELMRHTRMRKLNISALADGLRSGSRTQANSLRLLNSVGSWVGRHVGAKKEHRKSNGHTQYMRLIERLPGLLKFVPTAGALTDAKHYLNIFCYFLQPTPANVEAMILYALKHYVNDRQLKRLKLRVAPPENLPSVAIYHPDARGLFTSFEEYANWYVAYSSANKVRRDVALDPQSTIGLLLMRPQIVSGTTKHYDRIIHEIENEGLSVIPAIATLMDNREASKKFFSESTSDGKGRRRVSQVVSLTGFSFVGGPAMNDSNAAAEFLNDLNVPYRSAVSLDTQNIESWQQSRTGLNPVQAGMQVAIPEIDGATEPMVFGGIAARGQEPIPLEDRCRRFARRLKWWNKLQSHSKCDLKLAVVLFCFPPNKGNIGTAADLDVFPSVHKILQRLKTEGYEVEVPDTPVELRERLLGGNSEFFGTPANVAYRMTTSEYRSLCAHVDEVESDWGPAPGYINALGGELLIQGLNLGNVFVGVQPTFGFEGDPMRLMMAQGGSPHHGFMAFYSYISEVFKADALIHVGTHGAMEFMPGKQVGLSARCWPDRLVGELPNFYIYSVNNPSEGSIAKRRSYAELISYLTPPIESAGLYKELSRLKDLVLTYRQSDNEQEREKLFEVIQELSAQMKFNEA